MTPQERQRAYKLRHPERTILQQAKHRAKTKGLPFALTEDDITIPERCPILGIKLCHRDIAVSRRARPCSPSLDRIRAEAGYVKGNVRVISNRANILKSNATIEEAEAILADLRSHADG